MYKLTRKELKEPIYTTLGRLLELARQEAQYGHVLSVDTKKGKILALLEKMRKDFDLLKINDNELHPLE